MLKFHIDSIGNGTVIGWAFDDDQQPVEIEAHINGAKVGRTYALERPDVVAAHPMAPEKCGSVLSFDPPSELRAAVAIEFRPGGRVTTVPVLNVAYARFLRAVWSHFLFVRDCFPRVNPTSISVKDAGCATNSPEEMIAIANHLYVLKSSGLTGAFAEFGCFKGYSTSMLSYACELLGIKMHVFDSFEGLPLSDSAEYLAGEFKGTLDEVKRNVEMFGSPGAVTYHKGFFSNVLPAFDCPPLVSLWMDVDLATSAHDVMTIFPKVDPRGAVFSHECEAAVFRSGINQVRHPNHVVPPILDAYSAAGAKAVGQYVAGSTGAFWREGGIPVARNDDLLELLPHR